MEENQNQQQGTYVVEEQPGISFLDLMGVLFGRKLLLLIITLSLFLVSSAGILWLNRQKSTYQAMYNYYVSGLSEGTYIDGSRFDVRDLVTLEKLNEYKEKYSKLSDLDMDDVYYNGVIKSLKYETFYKENDHKMTERDVDYIVDKAGYRIVFNKNAISKTHAQVLAGAIAREANVITQQIVENSDYSQYLTLYSQSKIYEKQINYLQSQYDLIYGKYSNLIGQYGDVVLSNGKRLSDIQLQMQEHFQNVSFASLSSELAYNGYVKDYTDYTMQLEKQKEALTREKKVDEAKKTELINQRDQLLAAAGSLYSVELSAYNDQIISLTNRIIDIDEEVELIDLKLTNQGREETDPDYKEDLDEFKGKLEDHFNKITEMTTEYTTIEKEVVKKYSIVYFDSNSIVTSVNGISVIKFMAIGLFGSFFIGLLVNLCLDGKKLAKKKEEEKEEKQQA